MAWHSRIGKWQARITYQGKTYHLGYYDDINDAIAIRKTAEIERKRNFEKWFRESNRQCTMYMNKERK